MDPLAVGSVIAAGSQAVSLLRGITDNLKTIGKTEVLNQLLDLQMSMMDILQKQQELISENTSLNTRLREIESAIALQQRLEHHHDFYWIRAEDGALEGPYSPQTWDLDRKLLRMKSGKLGRFDERGDSLAFACEKTKERGLVPVKFLAENRVRQYIERTA
jgi:hypothetical protein